MDTPFLAFSLDGSILSFHPSIHPSHGVALRATKTEKKKKKKKKKKKRKKKK